MSAVETFQEILKILEPHYEVMPLNPPASESEISALENDLPFTLPEDFKAMYRLHNGEYLKQSDENSTHHFDKWWLGLFCQYKFLSLDEIRENYRDWLNTHHYWYVTSKIEDSSNYTSMPQDTVKNVYVNTSWLPFAKDGGGNNLAIDFSPDLNGVSEQIITFGPDDYVHYQISTSFIGFLEFVLKQYQMNKIHHKLSSDGEDVLGLEAELAILMK